MKKNLILTTLMAILSLGAQAQIQLVCIADTQVHPQYQEE